MSAIGGSTPINRQYTRPGKLIRAKLNKFDIFPVKWGGTLIQKKQTDSVQTGTAGF